MIRRLPPYWFPLTGKLQKPVYPTSGGSVATTYVDKITSLSMRLVATGGGESTGGSRITGTNSYTIYLNGNPVPNVTERDRIIFGHRVFDVSNINNADEANAFLKLICTEVFPSGVGA